MMKLLKSVCFVVTVLFLTNTHAFSLNYSTSKNDELLDTRIKDFKIQDENIPTALSEIAHKYHVPIGLEVALEDDLLESQKISIDVKDETLKNLIDSIVSQNTLYTWDVKDNVINVFPKEGNRDSVLKEVINTKIEKIHIGNKMDRLTFRDILSKSPNLLKVLKSNNITARNENFLMHEISPFGNDFSFDVSGKTLGTILNRLIKESNTNRTYAVGKIFDKNKE